MATEITTNTAEITEEQAQALRTEIISFQEKSLEYAASIPMLSSHYNRLYQVSKKTLDRLAKKERIAKDREAALQRKQARMKHANA